MARKIGTEPTGLLCSVDSCDGQILATTVEAADGSGGAVTTYKCNKCPAAYEDRGQGLELIDEDTASWPAEDPNDHVTSDSD